MSQQALDTLLLKNLPLTEAENETLKKHYDKPVIEDVKNNDALDIIAENWLKKLVEISNNSRTAQLWILYWTMVHLKIYVRAEREGNWSLHLHCTKRMISILYATGHNNYAKYAHLYVLQIKKLKTLDIEEYNKFVVQRMFAIKITEEFWCGTWTDMVIEQDLTRSIKTQCGGFKEATLARWITSMASCSSVSNKLEEFSGLKSCSSEQHVKLRHSRQQRDEKDFNKFLEWL